MPALVKQYWIESEQGWGQRPDGHSLHLTEQDRKDYIREYWDAQPKGPTPSCYERPEGNAEIVNLSQHSPQYKQVEKSKNGVRYYS